MEFFKTGGKVLPLASTPRRMNDSHINIGPIGCQLSNLTVFTTNANPEFAETVLQDNQPFSLQATVKFSGPG
nr:hypothetical protein [Leptolyngbyaceae cyanobacterium MO_188.B28]